MKDEGVDLGDHRARAAQARDLASFDALYCMTEGHREALARSAATSRTRSAARARTTSRPSG
jgi:protein-tyrosine-phosphatase